MAMSAATPSTAAAWNAFYAGAEHPYCSAACGPLVAVAAALPVGRAVDIGCGCGRHARALADLGWHVEAVDYSSAAIEIARAGGDTDLIDYHLADACWWHPHTPVHLVVIAYPTLAPNALNALLARAAGWMTPDGTLVYAGDTPTETTRAVLGTHFTLVTTTEPDPVRGAPTGLRAPPPNWRERVTTAGTVRSGHPRIHALRGPVGFRHARTRESRCGEECSMTATSSSPGIARPARRESDCRPQRRHPPRGEGS